MAIEHSNQTDKNRLTIRKEPITEKEEKRFRTLILLSKLQREGILQSQMVKVKNGYQRMYFIPQLTEKERK